MILDNSNPGYSGIRQASYSPAANRVALRIQVPHPSAKLWIQDTPMNVQGPENLFISPSLDSNQQYTYTIKATWTQDGQEVSREKQLEVRPGQEYTVAFESQDERGSVDSRRDTPPATPQSDGNAEKDSNLNRVPPRPNEPNVLDLNTSREHRITSVGTGSITVTDLDGKNRQTFIMRDGVRIMLDGNVAQQAELREGQRVTLHFEGEAGNRQVVRIEARAKREIP